MRGLGLAAGCDGGCGSTGGLLRVSGQNHGRRAPYVTPVLMVLFDNGSVQCYTSPAYLSALERERMRTVGEQHVPSAAAAVGSITGRKATASASATASADGRKSANPAPPVSPPAKPQATTGTETSKRESTMGKAAATASLMDAVEMTLSSSMAQGNAHPSTASRSVGNGPETKNNPSTSPSPQPPSSGRKARPRVWQPPLDAADRASSSRTTLGDALSVRRRRAAERAREMAWGSSPGSASGGGGRWGATDSEVNAASTRSGVRSVRKGNDARGSWRKAVGAATVTAPGAGSDSSGHETFSSEDEAFVSFRSQVQSQVSWAINKAESMAYGNTAFCLHDGLCIFVSNTDAVIIFSCQVCPTPKM